MRVFDLQESLRSSSSSRARFSFCACFLFCDSSLSSFSLLLSSSSVTVTHENEWQMRSQTRRLSLLCCFARSVTFTCRLLGALSFTNEDTPVPAFKRAMKLLLDMLFQWAETAEVVVQGRDARCVAKSTRLQHNLCNSVRRLRPLARGTSARDARDTCLEDS